LEHWKEWIDERVLTQDALAKIDPALKMALDNEFRKNRAELRKLVPIKTDEVNRRLAAVVGRPLEGKDRRQVVSVLSKLAPK